ncbi:uncharacterized protein EDB93DRAFT_1179146 [Suillus bovinus]|uniref:uncharacterized protein n=1 Tax=Suillus bovinus TaxID=48563 RepID=UPI001B87B4CC|nr:uncharacterized protein EDB93DRAFT_1179146 [Suillus bovinus]KAG2130844.1 hypothetical protein EDB93DRAFT_1179146 [Suillus bovinus]
MNVAGLYPVSDGDTAFWSVDASAHDLSMLLPFPRRFRREGEPSVTVSPHVMLKQHCNEFDLRQTGNKAMLIEQLEVFSRDPDSWDRLRPGAHKSHKGPRTHKPTDIPRAGRTKQMQRRAQLDTRTSTEVACFCCRGAEMIGTKYPYQTATGAEPSYLPLAISMNAPYPAYIDEDTIVQNVSSRIVSLVQDALHEPSAVWSPPALGAEGFTHSGVETIAVESRAPSASPPPAIGNPRLLHLGDGTILQVDDSEIPDPPAISFAHDIAHLNSMWDDHSEYWKGLSVIVIRGHPIAVKYWPVLYRYGKDKQWKGPKKKWSDWRDIIECYRQGSPEQFWATFSAKGEHMKYSAIVDKLHDVRKSTQSRIVEQVRREFGATFDTDFTYRRGGGEYVMTRPSAIVKRYFELTKCCR